MVLNKFKIILIFKSNVKYYKSLFVMNIVLINLNL